MNVFCQFWKNICPGYHDFFHLRTLTESSKTRGGEVDDFPHRNCFSSIFASFCPIKLKIELHIDQPFSYRFPECFCDLKIFATPLAHFSSQGGPKRDKSCQKHDQILNLTYWLSKTIFSTSNPYSVDNLIWGTRGAMQCPPGDSGTDVWEVLVPTFANLLRPSPNLCRKLDRPGARP